MLTSVVHVIRGGMFNNDGQPLGCGTVLCSEYIMLEMLGDFFDYLYIKPLILLLLGLVFISEG